MIPTSQVSTFEIMGFFHLSKPVTMLSFLCLVSWNQVTEAVGYFECTDTATGTKYESSTKITMDFESSNKTISSVPMLTNTTAGYSQFESTNREVAEVGSSPLTEASINVSKKSTGIGTTCSQTSSQVVASSTSHIGALSTEFEGKTETESESFTTKQETTEAESTESTASSTKFDSTEKLTSRLTTEFETTTKVTTLEKTTESETTEATSPRETTAAGKCCTDCHQLYQEGYTADGIYEITPSQWPGLPFDVYCKDGWTVIQRRIDGSVDFKRNWDDYKEGFGSPDYELWLGNEKIFHLTNQTTYELHIDLIMSDDTSKYLNYKLCRVADEGNKYKLTLDDYTGNAGKDFMGYHSNQFFTTFDRDNDLAANENCAISHDAGWWFNFCYAANLNGDYHDTGNDGICVVDRDNFEYQCGIKYCEMKDFQSPSPFSHKSPLMVMHGAWQRPTGILMTRRLGNATSLYDNDMQYPRNRQTLDMPLKDNSGTFTAIKHREWASGAVQAHDGLDESQMMHQGNQETIKRKRNTQDTDSAPKGFPSL